MASCVPQVQAHGFSIHCTLGTVVVKHCGDVLLGESIGCVTDEKTSFPHSSVSDYHTLNALHGLRCVQFQQPLISLGAERVSSGCCELASKTQESPGFSKRSPSKFWSLGGFGRSVVSRGPLGIGRSWIDQEKSYGF